MTTFADELFADLMTEHGPALARVTTPARPLVPRPVWLAAGVVGMAGAVTAGISVFGSGTPAYAVTPHGDGTVTISINQMTGVDGANNALRGLGDRVVVVPVKAGCPAISSLPVVRPGPRREKTTLDIRTSGNGGSITVDANGVPAGDTMLVAAAQDAPGITVASVLISGPAPKCVSGVSVPGNGTPAGSGYVQWGVVSSGGDAGTSSLTGH